MSKPKEEEEEALLLDPKTMDGPVVRWAPNDMFHDHPRTFLTYHVMQSGYAYLTPVGATVGGLVVGMTPLRTKWFPQKSALQLAGTAGFGAGLAGCMLGFGLIKSMEASGKGRLPFDDDGITMRRDGLSHNFMVRVMDLGTLGGLITGGLVLLGGPTSIGLSSGALGAAQAFGLAGTIGSLASFACIAVNKKEK